LHLIPELTVEAKGSIFLDRLGLQNSCKCYLFLLLGNDIGKLLSNTTTRNPKVRICLPPCMKNYSSSD
jgi:hypothetical protein